jgi:hypothetical protein
MIDIPADKAKHVSIGAACGMVGGVLGPFALPFVFAAVVGALVVPAVVGAWKEAYWDPRHGGTVDPWDFVATVLGGVFVALPLAIPLMV